MLGLKRGTVLLCDHCKDWEIEANRIITQLKNILGDFAMDIQHIGSTSIKNIKAKPIIDIAIGVKSFDGLDNYIEGLLNFGVYKSSGQPFSNIVLFSKDDENGNRLNNIQVVIYGEEQWNKHILFRDYMNAHPDKAIEYDQIKITASELFPTDVLAYSNYKSAFINNCIEEAKKGPMKIITICGSYKFKQQMIEVAEKLTLEGNCVLMPNELTRPNKECYSQSEALMFDKMHKEKIKLSDAILVIDVGGYIGNSTKSEIEYAETLGREIIYYSDVE